MSQESKSEEVSLPSVVATLVISGTMITAFGLLAAGVWWFWAIFVVGFAGVLPAAVQLAKWYESGQESTSRTENDPLEALRERYASGEIDRAEFDRRVERLLETESETDAEQLYGESTANRGFNRERERERN